MTEKVQLYRSVRNWFVKDIDIHKQSRAEATKVLCGKISEAMGIERVGLWLFHSDQTVLMEDLTLSTFQDTTQGVSFHQTDYPLYFNFILQQKTQLSSNNYQEDWFPKFKKAYFEFHHIKSFLHSPIFSDGNVIGILCCESLHPRAWDTDDESFVDFCADFFGRLIESEKRHIYENELCHRILYLENDLKRRLDDLNEAQVSLNLAIEGAQAGKWDWDISSGKLSLNKTWYTKLGYEFDELPQTLETYKSLLHPEDGARVFLELEKHLAGETPYFEARYRMLTKEGEIQWCLDRGCISSRNEKNEPTRVTGVNINVTPMVKLEESLFLSEQQLKAMIQSLPTPVAMFDKDFKYLAFSTRWEEEWSKFGTSKEGHSIRDDLGAFKLQWLAKMEESLTGKTLSKDEDLVDITADIQLWLRWIIQPWKTANGEIGGVVVMAENITQRKAAEMKINQASKFSALGEMAGGIAHEINNPLSIIKGYIDLLKRHSSRNSLSEELMLQYVDKMDATVARISRIVNGMRRFSRESSMDEKVEYSLNKIIEETLDICQERINNNGTAVDVKYFAEDFFVRCRPVEVSQVLLNLINNAYQAVAGFEHPWIKIKAEAAENTYRILVSDCGLGIPNHIQQKLFQPFFTTKDIGVGTGLGLSISRGIIEEHHGRLFYQVDAPYTTFVIELPR